LNNGRGKAQDVLFFEGLTHNLLSVCQVCDIGCDVLFRAQDHEIRSTTIGKVMAKGVTAESNVYILKEDNDECYTDQKMSLGYGIRD